MPGTVGGREAHPPKALRRELKINRKVRRLAIEGAIAATASSDYFEIKYKRKPELQLPIVIESAILGKKPSDVASFIFKLTGTEPTRKIRAGKGKMRGRKYKKTKVLFVVAEKENARLEGYGFEIARAKQLNVPLLAPGGIPGRLVIWTESAIQELGGK